MNIGKYQIDGGKTVWKIAQYSSPTSPTADTSKTIYCIKAGPGFGSSDMSTGGVQTISTYTQKFDLKNKAEIPSPYIDVLPTGENYNKLLWVLDHLYIMPEAGKDNTENRNAFLANIIPDERYELLTDDDIDVIQQLAVWYFTNPTGDYHYENIELFINSTEGQDGNYKSLEDLYGDDGWDRQDAAEALYEYYIKGANASYTSGTVNSKPVELEKGNAKMQKIEDNYVAGPYKINKLLDVDYTISATYTDMDNKAITPTLGVKDENGNIVATNKTLKELEGTEFYLIMPVSSNITGIKMNITTSYKSRTLTYWSVENAPNTEQPVVIVEETPYSFADEASLIVPKPFDLSLRKFITAVNDTEITSRIPVVDTTALKDGTATTATYTHPKDPVLVSNGNIVTYTIRVYNEGEIDGYAQKVKDDIPEGLEFLPDNETNKEYRWKLLDEDGNETEDVSKAKSIVTDYLSKEQEKTSGENLIKAFDENTGVLLYKDVKVAFKVIEPSTSDRIIINQAQISEDADKNGNDVDDRDSTPDKWIEGEDDQDIEKIKVQYFDLALRKWVTQAIVIENGEEKITETGHKAEDDPEAVVKVDLKKSKIDQVTVKFRYKIRVTNEGTIAGYVKEIKDYIPDGLKFVAEDNPLWTQLEENIITTDQAKDILLQPGESTEVEVLLTWINGENNMKVMDNWAEISKDYNDYGSPDIDSTPDNRKHGEDDIDDAPVIITVQTGQMQVYVTISLSVLAIVGTGIVLIKKFVM